MDIIKYEEWSERVYNSYKFTENKPSWLVIHHSESPKKVGKKAVRDLQDWHVDGNKWLEIGYHFIIDSDGNVYEGRKENHHGSHCYGYNQVSLGICLIGNFDNDYPNENQYNSLIKLIKHLKQKWEIKENKVAFHRTLDGMKCCPGNHLDLYEIKRDLV